jgi:hypothetical protein
MRACCAIVLTLLVLVGPISAAPFRNLDFEQATVVWPDPLPGFREVDPALAFPGWTIEQGSPGSHIYTLFNNLTLGASAITLFDDSPWQGAANFPPIEGRYSTFLYVDLADFGIPEMKQVGTVPADARALTFAMDQRFPDVRVLIDDVDLPLVNLPGGQPNGSRYFRIRRSRRRAYVYHDHARLSCATWTWPLIILRRHPVLADPRP